MTTPPPGGGQPIEPSCAYVERRPARFLPLRPCWRRRPVVDHGQPSHRRGGRSAERHRRRRCRSCPSATPPAGRYAVALVPQRPQRSLSRVATRLLLEVENRAHVAGGHDGARSRAVAQYAHSGHRHVATVRRSTSVVLSDAARISRHRLWDDLLAYTPQQPLGPAPGEVLPEDVLYTRGTVGLH